MAGVILVKSGQVDRWLNTHPEKRVIRFESVWPMVPGVVHVRGFHVVNQGRGNQLELVVDRATAFVDPVELVARRVHVLGLQAWGVEFRFRNRPKSAEEAAARAKLEPPIEGLAFEPYSGPPGTAKKKAGWTVVSRGATVREVRDVLMGQLRLKGPAQVTASVTVGPGDDKRIAIRSATIRYDGGELISAANPTLQDLHLHVQGRMEPFFTKQTHGEALVRLISARAEISGTSPGAALLNQYFARADWLDFTSGDREIAARLDVVRGRVQTGARVDIGEAPLHLDLAGFTVEGQAAAHLETAPSGTDDGAEVRVVVEYPTTGCDTWPRARWSCAETGCVSKPTPPPTSPTSLPGTSTARWPSGRRSSRISLRQRPPAPRSRARRQERSGNGRRQLRGDGRRLVQRKGDDQHDAPGPGRRRLRQRRRGAPVVSDETPPRI